MNPYAKVEAFNPMGCPPVPRCRHRRGDSRRDHLQQFLAGSRDIVGGRSAADEQELSRAREIAFEEMTERARSARTP